LSCLCWSNDYGEDIERRVASSPSPNSYVLSYYNMLYLSALILQSSCLYCYLFSSSCSVITHKPCLYTYYIYMIYMLHMLCVLMIHIVMEIFEITISMFDYLLYIIIIMLIYGIKMVRKMPIILTIYATHWNRWKCCFFISYRWLFALELNFNIWIPLALYHLQFSYMLLRKQHLRHYFHVLYICYDVIRTKKSKIFAILLIRSGGPVMAKYGPRHTSTPSTRPSN
jgi:hypothetical protein